MPDLSAAVEDRQVRHDGVGILSRRINNTNPIVERSRYYIATRLASVDPVGRQIPHDTRPLSVGFHRKARNDIEIIYDMAFVVSIFHIGPLAHIPIK